MPTLNTTIKLSSTITANISSLVINAYIDQPFDRVNDIFLAGTGSVTFADYNGDWNPQNTSSPYYGLLVPMVPITLTADYASVNYSMFKGFIKSWTYKPANGVEVASMTVTFIDGLGILNEVYVESLTYYAAAGWTTGYRIYGILIESGWDWYNQAVINLGATPVLADPGTRRTALQAIQTMENSELGAAYCDSMGNFVFLDRNAIAILSARTPFLFNDDGTNISYQDVAFKYDTDFIYNYIQVYYYDPITWVAVGDSASQAQYFERALYRQDNLIQYYYDAVSQAFVLSAGRSQPILRISSITLDISDGQPANRIAAGLYMDRYQPIQVTRNVPGTSSITKDLICCGLTYTITPTKWTVKVQTMEPEIASFVLDGTYPLAGGILDTNQLSY